MKFHIPTIGDYEQFIGAETVDRIQAKADRLKNTSVVNLNSTYYGGGVAELLSGLTLLMNGLGIQTGWRVLLGSPDFFTITKKMHNGLQGADINLSVRKKRIYEQINYESSIRNHFNHDFVIVHDPQPLPIIEFCNKNHSKWIWRCHIDLTNTNRELWKYLTRFIRQYHAIIMSSEEYLQNNIGLPHYFFLPAIDPFSLKNRDLTEEEMKERLVKYNIPTDRPIVSQVSRFDPWKDPMGVIEAYKIAAREVECTLVLLGNFANDDPEGAEIFSNLSKHNGERIIILPHGDDSALVNTIQKKSSVVLQKSIREGFGLTVTEAMWKGTPVIGGNAGGIRYQIKNGYNGYLVSTPEEAAGRIVQILKDDDLRCELGMNARETVKERFLLSRYLEQYLDLFISIKTGQFDQERKPSLKN